MVIYSEYQLEKWFPNGIHQIEGWIHRVWGADFYSAQVNLRNQIELP